MEALIDGDTIAFRCAVSAENEPEEIAIIRTDNMIMNIMNLSDSYRIFLTGQNNFRKTINPEYKANRKDKPRPKWLSLCQDYLIQEYRAEITNGYEADDALGFNQNEGSVIFSNDKDLLMIPGMHFNFINGKYTEVSELGSLKAFYRQMLIGDSSDNIKGVDGIGKVKASRIIDPLEHEEAMHNIVSSLYGEEKERFKMNADCLWIMRKEGERFSNRVV